MYEFRDTKAASGSVTLPSEALQINGEYIENLIPGYRTLNVKGREALSPELEYYETGTRDGSTLKSKRYPARVITVKYQIIAESNTAFREAFNKLAGILDVEEAELIFNDETDKYYVGTPSAIGEVEPGANAVVGEFEIMCADPFKYSVAEKEIYPDEYEGTDEDGNAISYSAFMIDYKGTYKSFPTLETDFYEETETSRDGEASTALTGNGDCGYVAFFTDDEKIIQLGNPDEVQGESFAKSQTLTNQTFKLSTSWGTAAQRLWTVNGGASGVTAVEKVGTLNMAKAGGTSDKNEYYLTPKSYGSGKQWHGSSITRTLPADATSETGAANFTLSYSQKLASDSDGQLGAFQALLVNVSGSTRKVVAGVEIVKSAKGKTATVNFIINGKIAGSTSIDLTKYNKYFGNYKAATKKVAAINPVRTTTIKKVGNTVTFNVGGVVKSYVDNNIADTKTHEITFVMASYGSKSKLKYNGLYSAKFVKDNCTSWRNVPNKFSANDVVVADCRDGVIYMNGAPAPEYGALGNDWEEFYLSPGENIIGVTYSDWVSAAYAPSFKLRYREVFL